MMASFVKACFLFAGALGFMSASRAVADDSESPGASEAVEGESYEIVAGDVLDIRVFEHDSLSRSFPVPPSGRISLAPIGSVFLLGKTVEQLESELTESMEASGYLTHPLVSVVIKQYNQRFVYILEGVQNPRAYELPIDRHLRLTQVLSLGGGLVEDADRKRVKIFRRSKLRETDGSGVRPDVIVVNLDQVMLEGRTECDVLIQPDDTIVVPDLAREERQIFVGGKVKKPGAYPLKPNDELTVFRAIILAGGFDKFASPEDTYLIRKGPEGEKAFKLSVNEILKNRLKSDQLLQPNDIIWVPESFFGS